VVLHSITARFCLRPPFRHVDFHFRTYKRDLAILTEWWQQRIAWWELLNAACKIIWVICNSLRKRFSLRPYDFVISHPFWNICHVTSRKLRLPQCIMGDDLHINKQTNICYCQSYAPVKAEQLTKFNSKSSPMIHCGNRSFLEVTWQMFQNGCEMTKS
jgi:hypothetical protein